MNLRWLTDYGFPLASLTIAGDKTVVATDASLDDKPANVLASTAGTGSFILAAAYNQHASVRPGRRVRAVSGFATVILSGAGTPAR